MANINTPPARFENGGILQIGSDIVLFVEAGTLERVNPFTEKLQLKDRGVLQRPREGDEAPGTLRFDVKYTSALTAGELEELIGNNGNDSTNLGSAPEFTVLIKYPNYRGASAGRQFQSTKCYFSGAARIVAGTEFDRMTVEMVVNEAWAGTTY